MDFCCLISSHLCGFFWGVCVACQVLSQSCDTWTKTLTWGQTAPPVSLRAPHLLSVPLQKKLLKYVKTSWESRGHFGKTEGIQWHVDWKPSLVLSILVGVTQRHAGCTSHLLAKTWCSWSERQAVSPTLVGVPQAWHRLNQTGGQPDRGLMRLKPHQRLEYLSSLQSTCATLSAWWELKLPQNSPSSCNYSNSWFVITQ